MPRAIDISDLPQPLIDAIEALVRTYRERAAPASTARTTGWAKDALPELPDAFFEPLPPDVLDLFEGRAA
jgi:hypothetical protein